MAATDLIPLAEARAHLRLAASDSSRDAELAADWIPAVTPIVEDVVGPCITRTLTFTANGGQSSIVLPSAVNSVTSVTLDGTTLAASEYTLDAAAGILYGPFHAERQGVVVTYSAGPYATVADVPKNIKLAARMILAQLWQADQQGFRPEFGSPDGGTVNTPSGFAVPRRAYALLEPMTSVDVLAGFA